MPPIATVRQATSSNVAKKLSTKPAEWIGGKFVR